MFPLAWHIRRRYNSGFHVVFLFRVFKMIIHAIGQLLHKPSARRNCRCIPGKWRWQCRIRELNIANKMGLITTGALLLHLGEWRDPIKGNIYSFGRANDGNVRIYFLNHIINNNGIQVAISGDFPRIYTFF